jgi:DNA-binding MarR family transcriptional regulator
MSQSEKGKKDYRKGNRASHRKVEAQNAIRKALTYGERTFKGLLKMTELSRPALASNLEEMHSIGEIERKTDSRDHRVKHYSLTTLGMEKYEKQVDLEALKYMDFLSVGDLMNILKGSIMKMINAVTYMFESPQLRISISDSKKVSHAPTSMVEQKEDVVFPQLRKEECEILDKCLTLSVYSEPVENEGTTLLSTLGEFLESIRSITSSESVDVQRLKKIPNLTFVFRLDRDKLIEQYLEKIKAKQPKNLESSSSRN